MVSRYELGVSQVSTSQLTKISKLLDVPVSYFFSERTSTESTSVYVSDNHQNFKSAFVFDLDDTIVDGRLFCGETIARVITSKYPSISFDLVCQLHDSMRGMTIQDLYINILKELNITFDLPELLKQDAIIQTNNINKMRLFDGVVEILEFLKTNGKRLYICTNRTKPLLINILKTNNIVDYFEEVISCVDAGYKKPNPYCLVDLIKRSGIKEKQFIYFGDSEIDSQFAQNAGIEHIIFDQYLNNKNVFKQLINMFLEHQINGTN